MGTGRQVMQVKSHQHAAVDRNEVTVPTGLPARAIAAMNTTSRLMQPSKSGASLTRLRERGNPMVARKL